MEEFRERRRHGAIWHREHKRAAEGKCETRSPFDPKPQSVTPSARSDQMRLGILQRRMEVISHHDMGVDPPAVYLACLTEPRRKVAGCANRP